MKKKSVRSEKIAPTPLKPKFNATSSKETSKAKKTTGFKVRLESDYLGRKLRSKTDPQTQSSEEYRLVTKRSNLGLAEEEHRSLTSTSSLQEVLRRQVDYLHSLQSTNLGETRQLFSRSTSSRLEMFQQRLQASKPSQIDAVQHHSQKLFAELNNALTRTASGPTNGQERSFAKLAAAYISHEVAGKYDLLTNRQLSRNQQSEKETSENSRIAQFKETLKRNKEVAAQRLRGEFEPRQYATNTSAHSGNQGTQDQPWSIYPKRLDHAETESVGILVSEPDDVRLENSPTFKLQQPEAEFGASPVKIIPRQLPLSLGQFKAPGEAQAGPNIATSNVFSTHTFGARDSLPTLHGAGRLALGGSLVSVEGGSARDGKDLLQMLGGDFKKKYSSGSMHDVIEEQPTPFDEKLEQPIPPPSHRSVKSQQQNMTPKSSKRPNSSRSSKLADGIDLVSKIDLKQLHHDRASSKLNSPESFDQFEESPAAPQPEVEQIGSTDRDVDRELNQEVLSTKNASRAGEQRSEKPCLHPSSPPSVTGQRSQVSRQPSRAPSTSTKDLQIPAENNQQEAENLWLQERIRILTLENSALERRVETLEKDRSSLVETFNMNLHEVETDALRWKAAAGVLESKIEQLESDIEQLEPLSGVLVPLKVATQTVLRTLDLYDKGLVSDARDAHVQTALALKEVANGQENCPESIEILKNMVVDITDIAQDVGMINLKIQQLHS